MSLTAKALAGNYDLDSNKDYLNISENFKVIETLIEYGDEDPRGVCLSDDIYVFNSSLKRKRRRIIITQKSLFMFSCITNKDGTWKLLRRYPLKHLRQVVISSKNFTMAAFIFIKGPDFMIDSVRRIDIVIYLSQMIKRANMPMFRILYLKSFDLKSGFDNEIMGDKLSSNLETKHSKKKGKMTASDSEADITVIGDQGSDKKIPILQETFRNVKISGFLKLRKVSKGWFSTKSVFKEYFFILTNVGVVYFKHYGVSQFN